MKRITSFVILCLSFPSVFADVDERMVGTWSMTAPTGQPLVLDIAADGRFATTSNGFLLESGTMDTSNDQWSIKSDVGRLDKGTYSLTDGGLEFTSGTTGTSKWARSKGSGSQASLAGQQPRTDNRLNSNPLIKSKIEPNKRKSSLENGQTPGFSATYGGTNEYHGAKRIRKGW